MAASRNLSPGRTTFWLMVCFVCSGMSGLIYEVAWVRSLELIFGATTFAVATVLAAFMGGLALGSYFMGRVAHRFERFHPLAVYGVIECAIAVFAILIPTIFKSLIPLYQTVWSHFHASFVAFSIIRFFLCVAILLVPTFLMGATLPIVSNFVGSGAWNGNRRIGLLYTFNTLGAVLGCAAAGLILFPAIGLSKTQWVAVLMNVLAATGAFVLARCHKERTLAASQSSRSEKTGAQKTFAASEGASASGSPSASVVEISRQGVALLVTLYAISGFTAMLYEVAWSRVLVLVLGSSTYAYTIMLATFLLGLSLGAYLATRYLSKVAQPLLVAGIFQVMIALVTYAGVFLVEELPFLYLTAFDTFHFTGRGLLAVQFAMAIALMILPTLGLGAMFPITIRGLNASGNQTARVVGWSYALNTCGAIAGSVLAGFWLVPHFGSQKTMIIGIAFNALAGTVGILSGKIAAVDNVKAFARNRRIVVMLIVAFVASLFLGGSQWKPYILSSGIFRYVENYSGMNRQKFIEKMRENRGEILLFKEGLTCTVTVCQTATGVSLLVNGKPDASVPSRLPNPFAPNEKPELRVGDLPTQVMLGQVPMLLAPRLDRAMVIGLGSGVTLGSVLRHPVKQVECVELEDAVVKSARFFKYYNGQPLYDKRVELIVNDARNHLLVTDKKYDVIISEPSNPWIAGAASLFTSDFFQIAKSKLSDNGVFCQWIQLYELRVDDFQTILRSFTDAFPQVHIFRVDMDAIVVGSLNEQPLRLDQLQTRLTSEVKAELDRIECANLEDFFAYYWIGGQELRSYLPPGPRNTDDNMLIEFAAPLRMLSRNASQQIGYVQELSVMFQRHSTGLVPHLVLSETGKEQQSATWARLGAASLKKRRVLEAKNYAERSLALSRNALAVQVLGDALWQGGKHDDARQLWAAAEKEFPRAPVLLRSLAKFHQQQNDFAAARQYAERLVDEIPSDRQNLFLLGQICYQAKDFPAALRLLEPLRPAAGEKNDLEELPYFLGSVYWNLSKHDDAIQQLEGFVARIPNHLDARYRLADSLMRAGRQTEAFSEWQRVSQLRDGAAQMRLQEGKQAWAQGQRKEALTKYEDALQFDPWNDDTYFTLSRARKQTGDLKGAVSLLEKYLTFNPDRPWAVSYLAQLSDQTGRRDVALLLVERYRALTGLEWQPTRD